MQRIFDGPVAAGIGGDSQGFWRIVGEVAAHFGGGFIADDTGGGDTDDAFADGAIGPFPVTS